jgi:mRNA interferase HicA
MLILDISAGDAHIFAHKLEARPYLSQVSTARLVREGWQARHGGDHDVYKHPTRPGRIILPRHRTLSPGVARAIAKLARWVE